jgi:hypothetical protein
VTWQQSKKGVVICTKDFLEKEKSKVAIFGGKIFKNWNSPYHPTCLSINIMNLSMTIGSCMPPS